MKPEARWSNVHRLAQIGICVQFLALVRTLAEFAGVTVLALLVVKVTVIAP